MIQINIPMPKHCYDCPICYDGYYCPIAMQHLDFATCDIQRMDFCPLEEVTDTNAGKWISVKDGMPKRYGNYFAVVDGEATECTYSEPLIKGIISGWSTCDANGFKWLRDERVTYYMQPPEPPKEE